ncbi:MAG: response regulator [Methanoregula sp.]
MAISTCWNVFIIDDDKEILKNLKKSLNNKVIPGTKEKIHVTTSNNFDLALNEFESERFDLVIVDVRKGPVKPGIDPDEEAGEATIRQIREKKFLPVIFYTGLPNKVKHLESPHVKIITKPSPPEKILEIMKTILEAPLHLINRALIKHLEKIQATYMWEFVDNFHKQYGYDVDTHEIAYLLARRMSLSLSDDGIKSFLKESGGPKGFYETGSKIHPMQYYVIPPVFSIAQAGDLFFGKVETKTDSYWCLLTPTCDIEPHRKGKKVPPEWFTKAEYVVFAKCVPLKEQSEYSNWYEELKITKKTDNKHVSPLMGILTNNRKTNGQPERFVFLPGVLSIPDLIIDFQQLKIAKLEILKDTDKLKRIASIDPPYSDSILSKFSRYFGRVGTPDLNCACIISKYEEEMKKSIKT